MRAIDSILLRLQQRGVGVQGTTLFAGTGADIPAAGTIVTVSETGGPAPQDTHNSGSLKQPTFQVVARSQDYRQAAAKADAAYAALDRSNPAAPARNILIGDVFWLWIRPLSEPFTLPTDANGRSRVAFNIESVRRG